MLNGTQTAINALTPPPVSNDQLVFSKCHHITPPCERGLLRFEYTLGDIDLVCDLEYERAQRGSRESGIQMEPDYPENATLWNAYVLDVNIAELLSPKQCAEIEEAFLAQEVDA